MEGIVAEREKNGPFKDIYDFVERVNLSQVNRKTIESLALAGAFDSFEGLKRSQFLEPIIGDSITFSEALGKYGQKIKSGGNTTGNSLFGGAVEIEVKKPMPANCEEWSDLVRLDKEKELVGIYLSAHPLDRFRLEIETGCNATMEQLADLSQFGTRNGETRVAGIVTNAAERTTKTGNPWGQLTVEDFSGSYSFALFGKDYMTFKPYFIKGMAVLIKGKVQGRFNNPNELEFKISSIDLLDDVKDKLVHGITLKVPITDIDTSFMQSILSISDQKAQGQLNFEIFDPKNEKIRIKMHSRTHRVNINNELISNLKRQQIEYMVS